MSKGQEHFWSAVLGLARATRMARKVDLDAAADALALERQAEKRLAELSQPGQYAPGPLMLAAARRDPTVTRQQ